MAKRCVTCDGQEDGSFTSVPLQNALEALKAEKILTATDQQFEDGRCPVWAFHFEDSRGKIVGCSMDSKLTIKEPLIASTKTAGVFNTP